METSRFAVLLLLMLSVGSVPASGQAIPDTALVITEVLYAPSPASNEFVELYNRSDSPIDLGQVEYADDTRDFTPVAPTDTMLAPGDHIVLARDESAFRAAFPGVNPLVPSDPPALNNGGDLVLLRDAPTQTVLDSLPYTPEWGGADEASLERIDPAAPSTVASNFGTSTADAGATPGRRNSRYDPDMAAPTPVFAEQVAPTVVEVTLSEPVHPSSVTPSAFKVGTTPVTDARLSRDTVATLTLQSPPSSPTLQARRLVDLVGNTLSTATRPLAYRPTPNALILNEIMYAPEADDFDDRPDQVEYLEVRNRGDRPLTLHNLVLTDRPDEDGVADTLRPGRKVVLRPHGYGVIAAAPEGTTAPSASPLAASFPSAPLAADSVAYLPIDAARLGLRNDGGLIRLHADTTTITTIEYSPDWHTPSLEETQGTALVRISPSGDAQSADNWTSSPAPNGGTPGAPNAIGSAPPDASDQTLTVSPSPFSIERDGATRIQYRLDGVPNLVQARIYDARGRKVRTLEDARLAGRTGELVWNGRDDAGNRVRIGVYVILFEAIRPEEGTVARMKTPVVVARPLK
ncbi:MAG: hypothetical protein BRD55_09850 [Bacteroidetes bacterium SW_9_63_38]|nr:MAG: hypothetical protein BRD55_09850 [Bacteroidetes bacterium SW_9_63_38]